MGQFSISFTVGKASDPNCADFAHNNREFYAPNIDPTRTAAPHTKNFLRNHSQRTMRSSVSPAAALKITTNTSQTANARNHFTKQSYNSVTAKPQRAARRTERLQENC